VEFSHHSLPAEKNLKEDPATYPQGAESIICIICSKESQFYRVILVLPSNWQTSLSVHGRSTISLPEKGKIHYFPLHNLNLYKQYASQASVIQLVTLSPSIRATILDNSTIEKIIKKDENNQQKKKKKLRHYTYDQSMKPPSPIAVNSPPTRLHNQSDIQPSLKIRLSNQEALTSRNYP
jgi:hypothetical protein